MRLPLHKFGFIMMVTLLVPACSFTGGIPATATATSSPTITPTHTSTPTPTVTSTPRNTPTDVTYILTLTALAPVKPLPGVNTATPVPFPTPFSPGEGFESVQVTETKLFWGICKPRKSIITITVSHPEEVATVYLFFRLMSVKSDDTTPWFGTVADNNENGTFTYVLYANLVPHRTDYMKAWYQYQFVAENDREVIVGRSQIYSKVITLEPCR